MAICARHGRDGEHHATNYCAGVTAFALSCDVGDAAALAAFLDAVNAALGGVVCWSTILPALVSATVKAWSLGFNAWT